MSSLGSVGIGGDGVGIGGGSAVVVLDASTLLRSLAGPMATWRAVRHSVFL